MSRDTTWVGLLALALGLLFLYVPMLVLVAYSFNNSAFVTLWSGFSFRWYVALFSNHAYWVAATTTLEIAVVSSVLATALGTMIASALSRVRHFATRSLLRDLPSLRWCCPR